MNIQNVPIIEFAKLHDCTISQGTVKFEDREATSYPALKSFFKRLDKAGNSFKAGSRRLCNSEKVNRFEVVEFFDLLRQSPLKFTSILLNGSYIDDAGAKAMASYIAHTDTLQVLDFHYSHVSEEGMKMIVSALKINKSIMQINLRSNDVTPNVGEELLNLVKNHNHTIRQMAVVQRSSFPSDPKPSVELEKAIHTQIIANAKDWCSIVNIARWISLAHEDSNNILYKLPTEICCRVIALCSNSIPSNPAMEIALKHFCRP